MTIVTTRRARPIGSPVDRSPPLAMIVLAVYSIRSKILALGRSDCQRTRPGGGNGQDKVAIRGMFFACRSFAAVVGFC